MNGPVCDYEGLISGSVTVHDRCKDVAAYAVTLGCGHSEVYCSAHREEFSLLLHKASIVCTCGEETHNKNVSWRTL